MKTSGTSIVYSANPINDKWPKEWHWITTSGQWSFWDLEFSIRKRLHLWCLPRNPFSCQLQVLHSQHWVAKCGHRWNCGRQRLPMRSSALFAKLCPDDNMLMTAGLGSVVFIWLFGKLLFTYDLLFLQTLGRFYVIHLFSKAHHPPSNSPSISVQFICVFLP